MEDEKKNKQKLLLIGIVVALGLAAAVFSGVKSLAPPQEQVVGSLDGPGGGGGMRDAEAGTSPKPAEKPADPGAAPPAERGTTPEGNAAPPPVGVEGGRG